MKPVNQLGLKLTSRELECLILSFQGTSLLKIAQQLGISKRTIDFHLGNIFAKSGTTSKYACMLYAYKTNEIGNLIPENVYKIRAKFDKILTKREREVVELLPTCEMHKEIATILSVTKRTIDFHARSIYRKLKVANKRAAIAKLFEPIGDFSQLPTEKLSLAV